MEKCGCTGRRSVKSARHIDGPMRLVDEGGPTQYACALSYLTAPDLPVSYTTALTHILLLSEAINLMCINIR